MIRKLLMVVFVFISIETFGQQDISRDWLQFINQGKSEYAVENYFSALRYFQSAAALVPFDTLAYHYIIDCAYKSRKYKPVFESLKKLEALRSDRSSYWLTAIEAATDLERNFTHVKELLALAKVKFPGNTAINFAEIAYLYKKKDYKTAVQKLDSFIIKNPKNNKALNLKFKIQEENLEDWAGAVKTAKFAQKMFPDSLSFRMQEADVYLRKKSFDTAQIQFEELIKINPKDPKLYYNVGLLYYEKKDYEKSAEICKKAIELDPNYLDAIYNVGTFYYNWAISYCQALSDMALDQYQAQGEEVEKLAKHYLELSKPFFERATDLNPNELDAFENMNTINVLLKNINANLAETELRMKADSTTKMTAKVDSVLLNQEAKIDTTQMNKTVKIDSIPLNIPSTLAKIDVSNANVAKIDSTKSSANLAKAIPVGIDKRLISKIIGGYGRIGIISDQPYIELNNIRFRYQDSTGTILRRGQIGQISFTVANRGNVAASNLKAILSQPYVSPDLKFFPLLNIGEIGAGEVVHITQPIMYLENSLETEAIEKADLTQKKMRLFIKEPSGFNSELKEFVFNMGKSENANVANTGLTIKNYLLLIGVDRYTNFNPANGSVKKAEALKSLLLSKYRFLGEDVHELYNEQVTVSNIRNELIKIKQDLTPNDNLLIYFAGQSYNDTLTDNCYWLPTNAEKTNLKSTVASSLMVSYLKGFNLKHICIISDAHFTESFLVSEGTSEFQPDNDLVRSRWLLSADKADIDPTTSVISQYLMQSLNENENSKIAISEILNFVKGISKDKAKQQVIGGPLAIPGNDGGEFIFYKKN